ncbi:MAG: hypothetical protein ACE5GF_06850 [Thermodesulfobacteriota bacterium]
MRFHYGYLDNGRRLASSAYAADDHDEAGMKRYEDRLAKKYRDDEEFWEVVHELFAGFTTFLILVNIAGAVFTSVIEKDDLIL